MFKYHRGTFVTNLITGFSGCITARSDSITGCNQYYVQPSIDKDGKHVDGQWTDEHSLGIDTSKQALSLPREEQQPPG